MKLFEKNGLEVSTWDLLNDGVIEKLISVMTFLLEFTKIINMERFQSR